MTTHSNLSNVEINEARDIGVVDKRPLTVQPKQDPPPIDPDQLHKDLTPNSILFRAHRPGAPGDFVVDDNFNVWDISQDPNGTDQWQHGFDDLATAVEYAVARCEGTSWCLLTREGHVLEQ